MLESIHVRNFALIEKADLELGEGLNILTGETGAGKSILIDAMNVVLGGKANAGMIRHGEEQAYVELVFHLDQEKQRQFMEEELGEDPEEGTLILSRKIMNNRSIFKLNDKTVTASRIRNLTEHLIDIHGQHEHESLLHKSKHLEILDLFAGTSLSMIKEELSAAYREFLKNQAHMEKFSLKEEERLREVDFLKYEINEIYTADLKENEEEKLEQQYKKISNSRNILESIEQVHSLLGYENAGSAGSTVSEALSEMNSAIRYDENLKPLLDELHDLESILSDLNRDVSSYLEELSFDEETYHEVSRRLDEIKNLEMKYGRNYEEIMKQLSEKESRLQILEDYDKNKKAAEKALQNSERRVLALCEKLSQKRKEAVTPLVNEIIKSLKDLNFLQVKFDIRFTRCSHFNSNGYDEIEFLLSTNPGQPLLPLAEVASGGELSRIMLAVKTVLADMDHIPTLIFDEIDTGISGRTAACVSEKLGLIARTHQVICITHLPQIAAKADHHFMIEKGVEEASAVTRIKHLNDGESLEELARLLGGTHITQAALENARSLKSNKM